MVSGQALRTDPEHLDAAVHGDPPEQGLGDRYHLHSDVAEMAPSGGRQDRFSRKIVGWATGPTIRREVVLDAVLMAVRRRRPRNTLVHRDQGTQFGSDAWRRFCRSNHLEPSMSRKGNCSDNAVVESFFSSPKKERIMKQNYTTREPALADVADYIVAFYDRTRRHGHLGGMSPEQFEAAHTVRRRGVH